MNVAQIGNLRYRQVITTIQNLYLMKRDRLSINESLSFLLV